MSCFEKVNCEWKNGPKRSRKTVKIVHPCNEQDRSCFCVILVISAHFLYSRKSMYILSIYTILVYHTVCVCMCVCVSHSHTHTHTHTVTETTMQDNNQLTGSCCYLIVNNLSKPAATLELPEDLLHLPSRPYLNSGW